MMNKLGAGYNVFDGEQFLETSIKSIRKNVDYIVVVIQEISNFGEKNPNILPLCKKLKKSELIDSYIVYNPVLGIDPHLNEVAKRNIGLKDALCQNCTHFISMDVDELYIPKEFKLAKQKVIDSDTESSACHMYTYYKYPNYIIDPIENYLVPFIYKIDQSSEFKYAIHFPILVDPTRRISSKNVGVFDIKQFAMHHLCYIRDNIESKFKNSSSVAVKKHYDILVNTYNNWKYPNKGCIVEGFNHKFVDIKKVKNIISIVEKEYNE